MEECKSCTYCEDGHHLGLICVHKASIEGIEARKSYYKIQEVDECELYEYDENAPYDLWKTNN